MARKKSPKQKANTGSSNVPRKGKNSASQIELIPVNGLPAFPLLIAKDKESQAIYNILGTAIMKYEQLFQNVDCIMLAMAAVKYKQFEFCNKIASNPRRCFEKVPKSHVPKDDKGKIPMVTVIHPAVKMGRDAQKDFMQLMKAMGLDLKSRAAIFCEMSMIRAMHANKDNPHAANIFFLPQKKGFWD